MNGALGLLWLLFLIGLAAWVVTVLASEPLSRQLFSLHLSPRVRARRSAALAAMPLVSVLSLLVATTAMALGKASGWVVDHCEFHGPGHPHLCFEHLPAIHAGFAEALVFGGVASVLALTVLRFIRREHSTARTLANLHRLSEGRGVCREVADDRVLALAAGWRSPAVLLSRGLRQQLDHRERRIVVAHEFAHLRRRDLRASLIVECLLLLHLPGVARRLRREWRQALEERADDMAAQRFGHEAVAETLLKVARLQKDHILPGLSAGGGDTARRIERLLAGHPDESGLPLVSIGLASIVLLAASLAHFHHLLETLLGFVTGH